MARSASRRDAKQPLPTNAHSVPQLISWNEIKSRALTFSRQWADAAVNRTYELSGGKKTYESDAERVRRNLPPSSH
jgi:hypothetical protein